MAENQPSNGGFSVTLDAFSDTLDVILSIYLRKMQLSEKHNASCVNKLRSFRLWRQAATRRRTSSSITTLVMSTRSSRKSAVPRTFRLEKRRNWTQIVVISLLRAGRLRRACRSARQFRSGLRQGLRRAIRSADLEGWGATGIFQLRRIYRGILTHVSLDQVSLRDAVASQVRSSRQA